MTWLKTASKTPTGAKDGLKAAATAGAVATPPIFAWLPTTTKKNGAFMILAATNIDIMCISFDLEITHSQGGIR